MSNRYLGVVALERFLWVQQYRESHQVTPSPHPLRSSGPDRSSAHPGKPVSRTVPTRRP